MSKFTWAYGVMTVPDRIRNGLLDRTLKSLSRAGFDSPTLFVDSSPLDWVEEDYDHPIAFRSQRLGAVGNWLLAIWELYVISPKATRYVVFQDDFSCYANLREYLERSTAGTAPGTVYWNLYTFPQNEARRPKGEFKGWYPSNQEGKSAVALIFDRDTLRKLLASPVLAQKPAATDRPRNNLDGCIIECLKRQGVREMVHYPSLVQHHGDVSAIGNKKQPKAHTYYGDNFNALEFL